MNQKKLIIILKSFYTKYNPQKLENKNFINKILKSYKDKVFLLFSNLELKYKLEKDYFKNMIDLIKDWELIN